MGRVGTLLPGRCLCTGPGRKSAHVAKQTFPNFCPSIETENLDREDHFSTLILAIIAKAMKSWEVVIAIIGASVLAFSSWAIRSSELPHRDTLVRADDCHMPVTILEPRQRSRGAAILFHGFSADRRVMEPLGAYLTDNQGLRAYLFDLAGHGDNADAFSFPRADDCARIGVESLIRSGEIDPKRTILVGHSLGGAIAIRAADREPVAGTIALSPAPMPLPRRMPANLLVFSAKYDLTMLKRAARALATAAGGERTQHRDFVEARAFHLEVVSFSDHNSLLVDLRVFRETGDWIDSTLENSTGDQVSRQRSPIYAAASLLGLLAILLLFPFCATVIARVCSPAYLDSARAIVPPMLVLAEGAVCALATVLILAASIPLSPLHLYTGDYLASLLLIAGSFLLALNWKSAIKSLCWDSGSILATAALGFAVMLGIGAWLNSQTADLWLSAPRWLRFAAILPVAWIFCFAEEVVLGAVRKGHQRTLRFFLFLALRAELWLACLFAYYALASSQLLILVLVPSLALFSLLQRLATDALRLRTGSAAAAALFGAILAAWIVAAIFPLT